jgi:hypothetical protein
MIQIESWKELLVSFKDVGKIEKKVLRTNGLSKIINAKHERLSKSCQGRIHNGNILKGTS